MVAPLVCMPIPANTIDWPNVGSKLGQRRRLWSSIDQALGQCFALTAMLQNILEYCDSSSSFLNGPVSPPLFQH